MRRLWVLIATILAVIFFVALSTLITFTIIVVFSSESADEMIRNSVVVLVAWAAGPALGGFLAPIVGTKLIPKANAASVATIFLMLIAIFFSALILLHGWLQSQGLLEPGFHGERVQAGIQMFCALLGGWLARSKLKQKR
jgi:hypothetical protein